MSTASKRAKRNARRRGEDYERKVDARCVAAGLDEGEGKVKRTASYANNVGDVVRGKGDFRLLFECKKRGELVSKELAGWLEQADGYLDQYAERRWPIVIHEDSTGVGRRPNDEIVVMRGPYFWEMVAFICDNLAGTSEAARVCERAVKRDNGGSK